MLWGTVRHYAWTPKCHHDCHVEVDGKHQQQAQRGGQGKWKNDHTKIQLYSMRMALCKDIVYAALQILALPAIELYI